MKNTFDFDFTKGDFVLDEKSVSVLTGVDALRLWIEKMLRTQVGRYTMYSGDYGVNIEDLIVGKGYGFDFIETELKREIQTALLRHDDITDIRSFAVSKRGTVLDITFTAVTVYGEIEEVQTYDAA